MTPRKPRLQTPERIAEITAEIMTQSAALGLNADLHIRQCKQESQFDMDAVSGCGAAGLMQLMPITITDLAQRFSYVVDMTDWRSQIHGGLVYMRYLLHRFAGDPRKALAAYNWGEGSLHKHLAAHGDEWVASLPRETRDYIDKISPA